MIPDCGKNCGKKPQVLPKAGGFRILYSQYITMISACKADEIVIDKIYK